MKDKKQKPSVNIGLVSNTSWSLYNFRIGLIRMLIAKGTRVYVFAPKDEYSAKLTSEGVYFVPIKLRNYSTNPIHDFELAINLFKAYRKAELDLIFHYTIKPNIYGSLVARVLRIPSIAVTTGLGRTFNFKSKITRLTVLSLYRIVGRVCQEMWFLNNHDREKFLNHKIISPKKARVLPSEGINLTKYREKFDFKKSPITRLLFAGRLLREKGVYHFVEAAQILKKESRKIRFELLGFIDERNPESVKRAEVLEWQNLGLIKYLGSTEDVRPYISRSDAIVFPSFYQEGVSRILLEAAAMCKPIITTRNVGCSDVVRDGYNGLLCKPKSVEDLVAAIRKFITFTQEERALMGQRGRLLVKESFAEEKVLEIYRMKIEQVLYKKIPAQPKTHSNKDISNLVTEKRR